MVVKILIIFLYIEYDDAAHAIFLDSKDKYI